MPNILSIGSSIFNGTELDAALSNPKVSLQEAQNVQQAVKKSRETYFPIVIVQLGSNLNLRKIRSHFQHASIFVILPPSLLTTDLVSSTFNLGFNEVLSYENHDILGIVLAQKVAKEIENRTNLRIMRIMSSLAINYPVQVVVTRKVHNDVHRVVFVNKQYQKFYGHKNQSLLGSEFDPIKVYNTPANNSAQRVGNRLSILDFPKKSSSGKKHWFDVHVIELTDPQNSLVEYQIAIEYDQTSRHQTENGISQLHQESIPSAEILLELFSESIENVESLSSEIAQAFESQNIKNGGVEGPKTPFNNFLKQNGDLLDFVKLEKGDRPLEPISFNLANCLEKVKEGFLDERVNNAPSLIIEMDTHVPVNIFCDEKRLMTSLSRLLSIVSQTTLSNHLNLKASILSERKHDFVASFKIGLQKQQPRPKTEEKKYWNANDLSSKLLIPQRIVKKMGGKIVSNRTKTQSPFFEIQLPVKYNTLAESIAKLRAKNLLGLKVLAVDDNEINRLILSRLLQKWNTTVTEACSGEDAVALVERNEFDIVLMDIQMPYMNGVEAAGKIKAQCKKAGKEIPILALSAFIVSAELVDGFDKWIDDFLLKPVNAEDLFHKIQHLQLTFKRKNLSMERSKEYRIIDAHHIKKFAGGDDQFMRQLIEIFLKRTPEYVADLREAVESKNWNKMKMVAHKLKPTFTYVGMEKFTERVGSIEDYASQKDLMRIHEIMDDVWADCQIAFDEYRDLLATL